MLLLEMNAAPCFCTSALLILDAHEPFLSQSFIKTEMSSFCLTRMFFSLHPTPRTMLSLAVTWDGVVEV